ncbi:uncharacterized protein SETTUDRAFT_19834 [Exserohilum turcica Et28A]|uniref:Uncharacterized protein n=1 Tax=Exserohilum turcicum (strain 28A) TaxID=671987 RepID=R0IRJ6_EXST2|nr:uncharacterized protein SETTUDRAFT_19834 [Exserohilum turcica Et28A]EOA87311.1 hypothetical protein SETTUDRAFT_19834 [Exserohilum turcica Et28A]
MAFTTAAGGVRQGKEHVNSGIDAWKIKCYDASRLTAWRQNAAGRNSVGLDCGTIVSQNPNPIQPSLELLPPFSADDCTRRRCHDYHDAATLESTATPARQHRRVPIGWTGQLSPPALVGHAGAEYNPLHSCLKLYSTNITPPGTGHDDSPRAPWQHSVSTSSFSQVDDQKSKSPSTLIQRFRVGDDAQSLLEFLDHAA